MYKSMIACVASLVVAGCGMASSVAQSKEPPAKEASPGVAVVELFTSEGCSSCPPADRNLAAIVREADVGKRPVYSLSWHVDYWNRLGWADPYSTAVASQRQSDYSRAFRLDEVYTPQMIVNGVRGFVGSKVDESRSLINAALSKPAVATVSLDHLKNDGQQVSLHYATVKAPAGSVLLIAATEDDLSSQVRAGENGGRILKHDAVVRTFTEISLANAAGDASLTLPPAVNPKHVRVVAFVQDKGSMAILGATAVSLSAAN